ncbi:MAG: flagellar export chaperone FlgN [candidate division FCPU426 bacterium]
MELLWAQLLNVMAGLERQAKDLTALACSLRESLLKEEVRKIGEWVLEQEQEMQRFHDLEREREALVHALGQGLGLDPEYVTATVLLDHVPPAQRAEYRARLETLKRAVETLKQEQAVNQKLLRRSQEFVHWLVQYLITPEGAAPMYDRQGASQQRSYYHFVNQAL